jgi:zinc transport system substrate-binding protein
MRISLSVIFVILLVWGFAGCGPQAEETSDSHAIWVTLPPQKAIVEAVAGEWAAVYVMVRPGQSPETYSPSVPQMAALAKADLYFGIGMPLERRILEKMERSMPQLRFVQTSEPVSQTHEHEHHAGCVHGDQDPHVWMDPLWMRDFVEQVRSALVELEPNSADAFNARAADLSEKLRALDASLRERFKPYAGRSFYINHPSLGHFAERYGLVQRSIEHAGSAPSAREIAELVDASRADGVTAIFSQPEFGRSSADVLARALGVQVVVLDVLSADYFSNMLDIAQALEDSFKQ